MFIYNFAQWVLDSVEAHNGVELQQRCGEGEAIKVIFAARHGQGSLLDFRVNNVLSSIWLTISSS